MPEDKQPALPLSFTTRPRKATTSLTPDTPIQAALGVYEQHMKKEGYTRNTRKAFVSDIRLLGQYLGIGQPIGHIGTRNLNNFLDWLLHGRGVPCSRKSYARRVTTLKSFFGWLKSVGVLNTNPATSVVNIVVKSPLPNLPSEAEIERALEVTQGWMSGEGDRKIDTRRHLLLSLLLQTGIKKREAMTIVPYHIDRSDPNQPTIFVRHSNPDERYKERRLPLESKWLETLDAYLDQYRPTNLLFTCTARNLEYVLSYIAEEAEIKAGVLTFEHLRWVSALRDFRAGVPQEDIRRKLGISPMTWRTTRARLTSLQSREVGSSPSEASEPDLSDAASLPSSEAVGEESEA